MPPWVAVRQAITSDCKALIMAPDDEKLRIFRHSCSWSHISLPSSTSLKAHTFAVSTKYCFTFDLAVIPSRPFPNLWSSMHDRTHLLISWFSPIAADRFGQYGCSPLTHAMYSLATIRLYRSPSNTKRNGQITWRWTLPLCPLRRRDDQWCQWPPVIL